MSINVLLITIILYVIDIYLLVAGEASRVCLRRSIATAKEAVAGKVEHITSHTLGAVLC